MNQEKQPEALELAAQLDTVHPMDRRAQLNWDSAAELCRLHAENVALLEALLGAIATIDDYLSYEHNGDPWTEDARIMGEMDINDYQNDGRLERARALINKADKL